MREYRIPQMTICFVEEAEDVLKSSYISVVDEGGGFDTKAELEEDEDEEEYDPKIWIDFSHVHHNSLWDTVW